MTSSNKQVRVACIQMGCEIDNKKKNVDKAIRMIDEAAVNGASIICLPEVFNTEYVCFTKRDPKYFEYAETLPGPTSEKISERAEEHGIYIIAPIFEKAAPGLYYNTAPLIGPTGKIIGKYRKTHIPAPLGEWSGLEKLYFRPGEEFKVFDTEFGKIGIIICYDGSFPETWRILALEGAEMIFRPSCISYATSPTASRLSSEIWTMNHIIKAYENAVFVLGINRVGKEEQREHFGNTMIVNPYGEILDNSGEKEEKIVSATIDLNQVGRDGVPFRDYRPELYHRITKPPRG